MVVRPLDKPAGMGIMVLERKYEKHVCHPMSYQLAKTVTWQSGGFCQFAPLDKSAGMGIIINRRGRCIRRSVPVSLKLYLDLNDPQKPSPCPVAVFAFQSLDSYRDRMTQNMNRKHEKHTVPPPFEEVTNRLTMYAASLRRVYTAGGFLSNSGGRMWASPLRGDGFPRQ